MQVLNLTWKGNLLYCGSYVTHVGSVVYEGHGSTKKRPFGAYHLLFPQGPTYHDSLEGARAHLENAVTEQMKKLITRTFFPRVVCLCGSTKFRTEFEAANKKLTRQGKIVLTVGWFSHVDDDTPSKEEKIRLDELHKRKIDLADEVFVINVGGYIGDSTLSEICYARAHNKPVSYLELE